LKAGVGSVVRAELVVRVGLVEEGVALLGLQERTND